MVMETNLALEMDQGPGTKTSEASLGKFSKKEL